MPEFSHEPEFWVRRWKSLTWPMLASTAQTLQNILPRAEGTRPQVIADVVLRDPLLVLQALRGINGMKRGSYGSPVLDVGNIVLLLGPRRFIEQFGQLPALDVRFPPGQPQRETCLLWLRRARLAGLLALEWGRLRLDMKVEELYVAALLHPLREWLILCDTELQQHVAKGGEPARQLLDWLRSREAEKICVELFARWNLPEHFVDLVAESRQQSPRSQCVALAVRLAHALEKPWFDEEITDILGSTAAVLKVETDSLWPLVCQILLKEARQHPLPDLLPLAAMLPLVPPEPEPTQMDEAEAAAEPSAEAPAVPVAPVTGQPAPPQADKSLSVLRALPADVPFKRVLSVAIQALQQQMGLVRVALFAPEGRVLTARHVQGEDSWKALRIPLDGTLLFARLMGKTQTLWMHGDNAHRLAPLLDPEERKMLGGEPWFAVSLCQNGQPLALLIAARARGAAPPESSDYLTLQKLTQELARRLNT